jgi:hypothetical protein
VLRRRGPAGRELLRAVPTIQRRTLATLHAAGRAGRPITAPLAVQALAGSAQRVLGNPRTLSRSVLRNAALQQRYVPSHPRRTRGYPSARATARHFRQPL